MKWKLSTLRHKVSLWRELWSGEWSQQPRLRDLSLWAGPPQRPGPQFPQLWLGGNMEYPAWDRRSLLTGSSRGGPSRRDIYLGTILCPANDGQWEVVEPFPGELSPGLPGAERSGKMHTDKALAMSALSHPVCSLEELDAWARTRVDSETSLEMQTDPLMPPYQLHHLGVEPPFPGPQSLSWQDVCSCFVGPRDVSFLKRQQLPLGSQEDLACQFASGHDHKTPWWLCRSPPMCCLSGQAHGSPWDLLGIFESKK